MSGSLLKYLSKLQVLQTFGHKLFCYTYKVTTCLVGSINGSNMYFSKLCTPSRVSLDGIPSKACIFLSLNTTSIFRGGKVVMDDKWKFMKKKWYWGWPSITMDIGSRLSLLNYTLSSLPSPPTKRTVIVSVYEMTFSIWHWLVHSAGLLLLSSLGLLDFQFFPFLSLLLCTVKLDGLIPLSVSDFYSYKLCRLMKSQQLEQIPPYCWEI